MTDQAIITLYGASDDLLEARWTDGVTEIESANDERADEHTYSERERSGWVIRRPDAPPFAVLGHYGADGRWSMSVAFAQDDRSTDDLGHDIGEVPALFRWDPALCSYAVTMVLPVPAGTTIEALA